MPRIDELDAEFFPSLEHELAVMKDDVTTKLTVDQIRRLVVIAALGGIDNYNGSVQQWLADIDADIAAVVTAYQAADALKLTTTDLTTQLMTNIGAATVARPATADKFNFRTVAGLLRTLTFGTLADMVTPAGFIYGLETSNNAVDNNNDIDIGAGYARDTTNVDTILLTAAMTKRVDAAWAAGSGNGGRMSAAAVADGTTYHLFVIKNPTTGVVDAGFDVSPTAPTLPTGYTLFRRIASPVRLTGTFWPYKQLGDEFLWGPAVQDVNVSAPGNSGVLRALTVPKGIKVVARILAAKSGGGSGVGNDTYISSPDQNDEVPATQLGYADSSITYQANAELFVRTNTACQIRTRSNQGGGGTLKIYTLGYIDTRGKNL